MKELKYAIGQTVYHTEYGKGIIKQVDEKNKKFTYFVICEDGTKVWCNEDNLSDKPIKKNDKNKEDKKPSEE